MATIKDIQEWTKTNHGFVPKSCWIAHRKEKKGLPVKRAWNRQSDIRKVPCPKNKEDAIFEAFQHFGMIK